MKKTIRKFQIEIKGKSANEVVLIDGHEEQFIKCEDGYMLSRNAYTEASPSLKEAVEKTLDEEHNPGVEPCPESESQPDTAPAPASR